MNIFADSSLLVEYIKNTKTDLLEFLIGEEATLYINSTVLSEFFFHYLASKGKKAPLTLKVNGQIDSCLDPIEYTVFLQQFTFVEADAGLVAEVPRLMKKHNLLPNDAIILATCLHHKMPYLASYDVTDFAMACSSEGIALISNVEEAKRHLPTL